jgi:hypothetical protein
MRDNRVHAKRFVLTNSVTMSISNRGRLLQHVQFKDASRLLVLVLTCKGCSHCSSVNREAWTREDPMASDDEDLITSASFIVRLRASLSCIDDSRSLYRGSWARPHTNKPQTRAQARVVWTQFNTSVDTRNASSNQVTRNIRSSQHA